MTCVWTSFLNTPTLPLITREELFSTFTSRWMNSMSSLSTSSEISVGLTSMMVPVEMNCVMVLPWKSRVLIGMSSPDCIWPCWPLRTTTLGEEIVWP